MCAFVALYLWEVDVQHRVGCVQLRHSALGTEVKVGSCRRGSSTALRHSERDAPACRHCCRVPAGLEGRISSWRACKGECGVGAVSLGALLPGRVGGPGPGATRTGSSALCPSSPRRARRSRQQAALRYVREHEGSECHTPCSVWGRPATQPRTVRDWQLTRGHSFGPAEQLEGKGSEGSVSNQSSATARHQGAAPHA